MQLQAERDHFVHSGIVNNLKKPRLKARDKDKEKDKDLAKLKAASMDKTLRKMKSIIVNMEVDVDMNLNKKDINMDMDINMDKVIDLTEEKCLPTSLGSIICVSDTEMSTDIGTTKDSSASQQPALSQSQTQSRSLSTSSVPPPPPPPPPPQPIITPSSHPINQEHLSDLRVSAPNVTLQRNITSATTANAQTSYFRSSWTST
ncbi:hypothetical protein BGX26_007951 [Mortierella sp. AD094]|nr:hypothetical protein BGX26_007951 [Mortierella sp. AD094]